MSIATASVINVVCADRSSDIRRREDRVRKRLGSIRLNLGSVEWKNGSVSVQIDQRMGILFLVAGIGALLLLKPRDRP